MASLVIAAVPVHATATILLAATSKSPIKAATTDVRGDDFLRLPIGNVAIASLRKVRGCLVVVSGDGGRRVCRGSLTTDNWRVHSRYCARLAQGQFSTISDACRRLNSSGTKCRPDSIKKSPPRGGSRAYGSVALGLSRSVP